jgi:AAA family ATP:ADP antiporter
MIAPLERWAGRAFDVRPGEWRLFSLSFLYFFCLLCGYYILRPLREEMGIAGGVEHLHWMFTATFVAMLIAVPLYGWAASRFRRARFLPIVYLFFIVNLFLFYGSFQIDGWRVWAARAFFVWVSVFNLFVVSVFWSFMVDLYTNEQARRLFGAVAAGGSIGAMAGPALTTLLAAPLGPMNLVPLSAVFLAVAIFCIRALARTTPQAKTSGDSLSGGMWDGISALVRSRYLAGIALFVFGVTLVATFMYFEQAHIVRATFTDSAERTAFFARIDLAVNAIAVLVQLFGTGRLIRWWGLTAVLALIPITNAAGLILLGTIPIVGVLMALQILRRAGEYALARPAREVLFTVTDRNEKYKVKNVIDTLVYRGGDAVGAWMFAVLMSFGVGLSGLAYIGAAIALPWLILAWWLGRSEKKRRAVEN